ncbi:MAG: cation:proton antiporter [Verrucomicrobiae bacterium]|nr:cation:proton antiporter [Verrucomicrobiae bacterium]
MSASQLSATFFLQMFVILGACRLVGMAARRLGQPQVVGEMIAGVLLGPSLLGWMAPGLAERIFPKESLGLLYAGSQLGVGLYMFLVGTGFETGHFPRRARSAVAVSVSGMVVPFLLGAALALWLRGEPGLFSPNATAFEAMLFLGAAMAITAFPMLARILHERGLSGTPLGTLALAAGAVDDAAAWCVLAIVLASFGAGAGVAVLAIAGGALYGLILLTAGRRALARLADAAGPTGELPAPVLAVVLMLFCLAAWITDAIGIHAVFGGFILGVAMPRGPFIRGLRAQLEPFAVVFLLPMFFTYSGLNTRLDLVDSPRMLLIALAVLAAAIVGKGGACWAAARATGADQRTALAVGTLMNARGLMELIILNIGLQHGVIQQGLFSILVLMAVVTTLMASPMFERVYGRHHPAVPDPAPDPGPG